MQIESVGLQLFSIRDLLKTPADVAKTLPQVRAIGYTNVQVSGLGPIEPVELRKILDDCGLKCCSTHEPTRKILHETESIIERVKILGSPTTAIPFLPEEFRSEAGYKQVANLANEAGRKLKAEGISLMYHNHAFEFQRYGEKTGLDILYDESDPDLLKAELDTYWVQYGGASPVAWCRRMANRMPLIHLKDMTIIDNKPAMAEIGYGNIDFHEVCTACEKGGVSWYMVEQDTSSHPPLESAKMSYEYIKEKLCT